MVEIMLRLTDNEARAVLRSEGFSNGHGVRKSQALQLAEMKIIGAISQATT